MLRETGMLGVFTAPQEAAVAIRALRKAGYLDIRTAMPAPFPEVMTALGKRSRLGWLTGGGALFGCAAGFAMTIYTSLDWPLMTGGKPIVSVPPFVIIAFELSVLIGAAITLAAMLYLGALGRVRGDVPDPEHRFSNDRLGIFVVGGGRKEAEQILKKAGAEEVQLVD